MEMTVVGVQLFRGYAVVTLEPDKSVGVPVGVYTRMVVPAMVSDRGELKMSYPNGSRHLVELSPVLGAGDVVNPQDPGDGEDDVTG